MKKVLASCLLISALLFPESRASAETWNRVSNASLSAALSVGIFYGIKCILGADTGEAAWQSFAITSLWGATKEFYIDDMPSRKDFSANELGAIVGVSFSILAFE